jgi:uncharacterized protein YceK
MKKLFLLLGVTCVAFAMNGCASIVSGTNYDVSIQTNAPNAKVVVKKAGTGMILAEGAAPLSVNLQSGDGFFTSAKYKCEIIDTEKNDKQSNLINAKFSGWFLGNLLFGGLIGMGIDGLTGGAYYLEESYYFPFSTYEK